MMFECSKTYIVNNANGGRAVSCMPPAMNLRARVREQSSNVATNWILQESKDNILYLWFWYRCSNTHFVKSCVLQTTCTPTQKYAKCVS